MINSCEFDQPLDLRMKALNLSLSTYRPTGMTSSGNSSNSSSSTSLISSSNIYGLTLQASPPTNNSNSNNNYPSNGQLNNLSSGGQHPAHQNYHHHHHHHHHLHNLQPNAITISAKTVNCNNQSSNVGFQRSTNIHCQPLNHHQPHPLASRLHPLPPPPPQVGHLNHHHHHQHQHHHQPTAQSAPPPSHHMHLSRLPTGRQQLSPPQPIHFHPFVTVKSLSVSSHHQLLSTSFPVSGQITSRTPPMSMQKHQSNQSDTICNNQHQLIKLSEDGSQQGSLIMTTNSTANNTSTNTTATTPPTTATNSTLNTSSLANSISNNQQLPEVNLSTASPITRQHSLVSRYNCKPCGIVFSQPETLRAHQRDYCTKRDRTIQTSQIHDRSQSAVSPTAVITNTNQQHRQISAGDSLC